MTIKILSVCLFLVTIYLLGRFQGYIAGLKKQNENFRNLFREKVIEDDENRRRVRYVDEEE